MDTQLMKRVPYCADGDEWMCDLQPDFAAWLGAGKSSMAVTLSRMYVAHPECVAALVRCPYGATLYGLFRHWQKEPHVDVDSRLR